MKLFTIRGQMTEFIMVNTEYPFFSSPTYSDQEVRTF